MTNPGTVQTLFGYGVLPALTRFVQKLADVATELAVLEFRHPAATTRMFEGISALTAGVVSTSGCIVMMRIMHRLGMIGTAAGAGETVAALASFATGVGGIAVPLYLVETHWSRLATVLRTFPDIDAILTRPLAVVETVLDGLGKFAAADFAPQLPSLIGGGLIFPGDIGTTGMGPIMKGMARFYLHGLDELLGWMMGLGTPAKKHPSAYSTRSERAVGVHPVLDISSGAIVTNGIPHEGAEPVFDRAVDTLVRRMHEALLSATTAMGIRESSVLRYGGTLNRGRQQRPRDNSCIKVGSDEDATTNCGCNLDNGVFDVWLGAERAADLGVDT